MSFGSWLLGMAFLGTVCLIGTLVEKIRSDSADHWDDAPAGDDNNPRQYTEDDMLGAMWLGSHLDKHEGFL